LTVIAGELVGWEAGGAGARGVAVEAAGHEGLAFDAGAVDELIAGQARGTGIGGLAKTAAFD
jgi:hypothetical protein